MPERLQVWKTSSREFDVVEAAAVKTGDAVRIEAAYLLAAGNLCIMRYTVHPSGVVETRMTFTSTDAEAVAHGALRSRPDRDVLPGSEKACSEAAKLDVPRIGVRFRMPLAMRQVEYYGRGPGENYADRNAGAFVGLYSTSADEMYFPYVRPQENGHRTDTRRVRFGKRHGPGDRGRQSLRIQRPEKRRGGFRRRGGCPKTVPMAQPDPCGQGARRSGRPQRQTPADAYRQTSRPATSWRCCIDMKQQGVGRIRQLGSHARTAAQNPRGQHVQLGIRHHSVLMQSMK